MKRAGFTIVELVITITIMGILLTLAVVNVSSSQVRARDDERKSDVEAIGIVLESYYRSGSATSTVTGTYPTTAITASTAAISDNLRDADLKSFSAPGVEEPSATFRPATNNNQTTTGVLPQPTTSQYIYQPLNRTGALCTGTSTDCRKFNIFYRLEADNTVYKFTSRNQ